MAALKIDMTIPLGAGRVHLAVDIGDVAAESDADREFLADTIGEFCAFAARTLTPAAPAIAALKSELAATVHDPSADVLRGVTGSRIREKL